MVNLYSKAAQILAAMPHDQRMDAGQLVAMLKNKGVKPAEIENAPPLEGRITAGDAKMHFQSAVPKVSHRELGTYGEDPTQYEDYSTPGGSNYTEHLLNLPSDRGKEAYQSPHFEGRQKNNLLAHFRTTTRRTADGRKLLHIEEVQSDWGQEGREKGFKPPIVRDQAKIDDLTRQLKAVMYKYTGNGVGGDYHKMMNDPEYERLQDELHDHMHGDPIEAQLRRDWAAKREAYYAKSRTTPMTEQTPELTKMHQDVEDAADKLSLHAKAIKRGPYVTSTQGWTDLALKHILHHAAVMGHHGITIAPGKVHARRYNMSKHVDEMVYHPESKAFWAGKDGRHVHDGMYEPEELPGLIGHEATKALLSQPREPYYTDPNSTKVHRLKGDMDFGGEGFKQFYDQMLPKSLAKLAQQHDPSVKVGTYEPTGTLPRGPDIRDLPEGQYAHLPITDQMRSSIKESGFPAFARGGDIEGPMVGHHNISDTGVQVASDIGGIPLPSMAISKAGHPLTRFGDTTLLAHPSMVTPSPKVNVWPNDAYTGRQPRGAVVFDDPAEARRNAKADPNFGHMRDVMSIGHDPSNFDHEDELMRTAQLGLSRGIDPKKFDYLISHVDEVRNKLGMDAYSNSHMPGLRAYGRTKRVLFPDDRFTPSGNRRPSGPYTLDAVVKQMRKAKAHEAGSEGWNYGAGSFRAAVTPKFRSMGEITSSRDKIVPSDQIEAHKKALSDEYDSLINDLAMTRGGNFRDLDSASEAISDLSKGKEPTWFGPIPPDTRARVQALLRKAHSMPSEYFEAKHKGAVPLSAFPAAIVPAAQSETARRLIESGVKKVMTYGSPEERVSLFRSHPDLMFKRGGAAK
jgi:hypothetical protein